MVVVVVVVVVEVMVVEEAVMVVEEVVVEEVVVEEVVVEVVVLMVVGVYTNIQLLNNCLCQGIVLQILVRQTAVSTMVVLDRLNERPDKHRWLDRVVKMYFRHTLRNDRNHNLHWQR